MADGDDAPPVEGASYKRKPIGAFAILSPELYTNPKVRRAGRNGRDVFIFALARNAARGCTGVFKAGDLDPEYVADMLRMGEEEARQGLERAVAAGLLAIDGEQVRIVGWDDTWARKALNETDARQLRREKTKSETETKSETKKQTKKENEMERQTQNKSKSSPGDARTVSGLRVCVPSPSASEIEDARDLINEAIQVRCATQHEAAHMVALLRAGHTVEQLTALGQYLISDEGAGWQNKTNPAGDFYMRQHVNVSTAFSDKSIEKYLAVAMSLAADQRDAAEAAAKAKADTRRFGFVNGQRVDVS